MNRLKKVVVNVKKIKGHTGYDIVINDDSASVQNYLDAFNRAIIELPISRVRTNQKDCKGCDLCCAERAPLTWIDVINLKTALKLKREPLNRVLKNISYIVVDGPVVDIMMRRGKDNKCIFLDRQNKLCKIYHFRPLVCQVFICAPGSNAARWLWEIIVNQGEDELVRRWLLDARSKKTLPVFDKGFRPRPKISDWHPTAFAGKKSYREVLIKNICPPELWSLIRNNY